MTTWKDLELRVCRALGGERSGPLGKGCSDCSATVPFSVECKRSKRPGPPVLARWIEQARSHGRAEGKPWLVVVAGHHDRQPVVALDFATFTRLVRRSGLIGTREQVFCRYCGARCESGGACVAHAPLLLSDPNVGGGFDPDETEAYGDDGD